jgi:hypothetical protein
MRILLACAMAGLVACGPAATSRPAADAGGTVARPATLRVDHAWVKDAGAPTPQAARQRAIEALRAKVVAGTPMVAAWQSLGVDGEPWHVAEGESYDYDVIPAAARDLPVGTVSPIIPGDGGLHLFRILARE